MEKKDIDWSNLSFGYQETDYSFVSNYKDGKWDEGQLTKEYSSTHRHALRVLRHIQQRTEKSYASDQTSMQSV